MVTEEKNSNQWIVVSFQQAVGSSQWSVVSL